MYVCSLVCVYANDLNETTAAFRRQKYLYNIRTAAWTAYRCEVTEDTPADIIEWLVSGRDKCRRAHIVSAV